MNHFILQMEKGPIPSGRGHRKWHKKGTRHNFDRWKNDERLWQQSLKENKDPALASVAPPSNWHACVDSSGVDYYQMMNDPNGMPQVTKKVQVLGRDIGADLVFCSWKTLTYTLPYPWVARTLVISLPAGVEAFPFLAAPYTSITVYTHLLCIFSWFS